jgi:hypothetical protein
MDPKVLVIDGKTYHSVEEMPEDVREKYEQTIRSLDDVNNNQILDAFETLNIFADHDKDGVSDVLENLTASHTSMSSIKIVIDGKEFDGLENLPPEARARYEEVMGKLDTNRNGVPDVVEGMINNSHQTAKRSVSASVNTPHQSAAVPVSPTITPDTSNGWMLVLAGLLLLGLCVFSAVGVWYFFLR